MPFWKRVHDAPPSGVATEEEIIEKACEEYLEFYGKPCPFVKCLSRPNTPKRTQCQCDNCTLLLPEIKLPLLIDSSGKAN
jgi:hypothetical protein